MIYIACFMKSLNHLICDNIIIVVFLNKISIFVNFFRSNFISLSMIWFAYFIKNLNHLIYVNIIIIVFFSQNIDVRLSITYQFRITIYFLFTINQKTSIDQNLKNSKSKNLNQHMFAKSIRIVFNEILFEKSINLLYKIFDVFCINLKFFVEIFFFIFIFFRLFSIFLFVFAFVSIIFVAKMNCINVYQQVISIIDRVNIELIVSKRNWKKTKNKMFEYSITKHFYKKCFVYTFYWMNCTYRLLHTFKYRYVNRCYTNFVNTIKLFVSWYNRFMIFKIF